VDNAGGLEKGGLEHMLGPVVAIQWGFVENRVGSEQCRVEGYGKEKEGENDGFFAMRGGAGNAYVFW